MFFSSEFCEIAKNIFLTGHLATACENLMIHKIKFHYRFIYRSHHFYVRTIIYLHLLFTETGSTNRLKSHMLFTCKNFMFFDFTRVKKFCSGNGGIRGGGEELALPPPSPPPPLTPFSTALRNSSI